MSITSYVKLVFLTFNDSLLAENHLPNVLNSIRLLKFTWKKIVFVFT